MPVSLAHDPPCLARGAWSWIHDEWVCESISDHLYQNRSLCEVVGFAYRDGWDVSVRAPILFARWYAKRRWIPRKGIVGVIPCAVDHGRV